MKQISIKEDIEMATVRDIFKSAEDIIFDHLSSTTPSENIIIKLLNGVNIERKYIKEKVYSKGMFKDISCPEHVGVKANISKYFNKKINNELMKKHCAQYETDVVICYCHYCLEGLIAGGVDGRHLAELLFK